MHVCTFRRLASLRALYGADRNQLPLTPQIAHKQVTPRHGCTPPYVPRLREGPCPSDNLTHSRSTATYTSVQLQQYDVQNAEGNAQLQRFTICTYTRILQHMHIQRP